MFMNNLSSFRRCHSSSFTQEIFPPTLFFLFCLLEKRSHYVAQIDLHSSFSCNIHPVSTMATMCIYFILMSGISFASHPYEQINLLKEESKNKKNGTPLTFPVMFIQLRFPMSLSFSVVKNTFNSIKIIN